MIIVWNIQIYTATSIVYVGVFRITCEPKKGTKMLGVDWINKQSNTFLNYSLVVQNIITFAGCSAERVGGVCLLCYGWSLIGYPLPISDSTSINYIQA